MRLGAEPTSGSRRQAVAFAVALLVCLGAGLVGSATPVLETAPPMLLLAALSSAVAFVTALAGARLGRRERIPGALTAGLAFTLTLPAGTSLLPAVVAMAFGWLVAREVFGKESRSFVHPAVLAHVFLALTWPKAMGGGSLWLPAEGLALPPWQELFLLRPPGGPIGGASALACLLGGVALLAVGRVSLRILVGVPVGMAGAMALLQLAGTTGPQLPLSTHLLLGGVAFGVTFLATDPRSSPGSNGGRWAHGLMVGFLIILLRLANPASPDGTMAAILVASIFAPLADVVARATRRAPKGARDV